MNIGSVEIEQNNNLRSRKNESRSLFKKCFKNPMFSFVPFEIWRDLIVSNADLRSIVLLSQTCFAFKEIVDDIGENNFNLSLLFRREGQIVLAKKYLLLCAENNNSTAMLHLGYAHFRIGWGISQDLLRASEWLKKSAELGNSRAMTFYADVLLHGFGAPRNERLSNVWAEKALSSKNAFAVGYCHLIGMGTKKDLKEAFQFFEISANDGDEFGQSHFGRFFHFGFLRKDFEKAFYWYLKSAKQGFRDAIYNVGFMYRRGEGCVKDTVLADSWSKKSEAQYCGPEFVL